MKRLTCLVASMLIAGCAATHPMAGRWAGKDASGGEVVLFLAANGDFEAVSKGERLAGTWVVDSEAEPDRIDLQFEGKTLSSIVKMQGDSLLIEQVAEDGKLPSKFTGKATLYQRQ